MPEPSWIQTNGLWTVTPTPVGDAGAHLNDNFDFIRTSFLPLSGGTLTGDLDIGGNSLLMAAGGTIFTNDGSGGLEISAGGGNAQLYVSPTNGISTTRNTLDDGSGNMTVVGQLNAAAFNLTNIYSSGTDVVATGNLRISGNNLILQNGTSNFIEFQDFTQQTTAWTGAIAGSAVTSGTVADARLSSNVVLKSTTNTGTPAHSAATSLAGSGTGLFTTTQWSGASGSTAYTINDIVTALKIAGILKV